MERQSGGLAVLAASLGSAHVTYTPLTTVLKLQFQGLRCSLLASACLGLTCSALTYMQAKHAYTHNTNKFIFLNY